MKEFKFEIIEGRRGGSLTGLHIEVKGARLTEFVAALNDLKLRKRDHIAVLQKAQPEFVALLHNKVRRAKVPRRVAREHWSKLAQVPRGYTLNLMDLDLDHLRRYYSIWLKNGMPELPGMEVHTMFDDQEMLVYFTHDAPKDALTNVPTKGAEWIDPLEERANK